MRVVVVGATGNVGTSLLETLEREPQVHSIVGVARRVPQLSLNKTRWVGADIRSDPLEQIFSGADAVVHLAWLIQPSHDLAALREVNVEGSLRVFRAAAAVAVPSLIYASSVGAYSPGPKSRRVDESWPVDGVASSFYSRHKAATERALDHLEREHPAMRVVRLRKALIFKRAAATGIRRLFFGPLLPNRAMDPRSIKVVPSIERLLFQAVHTSDVAEAYRLSLMKDVRGAFNIAAEPLLGPAELAELFGAKAIPVPRSLLRAFVYLTWKMRLQPTPPGWLDLALEGPVMDTTRAHTELGWTATRSAGGALIELLEGFRDGADYDTPPLARETTSPARSDEFKTGVGGLP